MADGTGTETCDCLDDHFRLSLGSPARLVLTASAVDRADQDGCR